MKNLKRIVFKRASNNDVQKIIKMYKMGFKTLFENYQDIDTNPYMESQDTLQKKMSQKNSYYFFIIYNQYEVGLIRVMLDSEDMMVGKISPLLILPEYENNGLAQMALLEIEHKFYNVKEWHVDTIKQESKLLYLYTKSGYRLTGHAEVHIKEAMDLVFLIKYI